MLSLALEAQIEKGVAILRQKGVVAYPTDTLYGLGAHAFIEEAVERVFEIKGRPLGMAIPILLADPSQMEGVAISIPDIAWALAERFWPGALTMVLPKAPDVPLLLTARGWKIAVRVPDHSVPRELVRRLGAPITGTSANLSGSPSATTADEVRLQMGQKIDYIIEGGARPGGRESTVIDLTAPVPRILRLGAISQQALEEVCGLKLLQ